MARNKKPAKHSVGPKKNYKSRPCPKPHSSPHNLMTRELGIRVKTFGRHRTRPPPPIQYAIRTNNNRRMPNNNVSNSGNTNL